MDRKSIFFQTNLIPSIIIMSLVGFLLAEIENYFSDAYSLIHSIDHLSLLSNVKYIFSIFFPFSVLIFFFLTTSYMLLVLDIKLHAYEIIEIVALSFSPFLLNEIILFALLTLTPNMEYTIAEMIYSGENDFRFNEFFKLSTFQVLSNICGVLFLVIMILLVKSKTNLSFLQCVVAVTTPPLLVYIFVLLIGFF